MGYLKVFSSTAHVWIPDTKHAKLDSKSQTLMFTGYSDNYKAYRLIDVETDHLIFSCDVVVDETTGPFMPSTTPSLATPDVGVRLPLGSHDGRASKHSDSEDEESTDPTPPDFSQDLHPDDFVPETLGDVIPPMLDVGTSTVRPKWWAKTIGDLCDDELLEDKSVQQKRKQQNTVNFALMANIHNIHEPHTYFEAKGIPEWEKAMETNY